MVPTGRLGFGRCFKLWLMLMLVMELGSGFWCGWDGVVGIWALRCRGRWGGRKCTYAAYDNVQTQSIELL